MSRSFSRNELAFLVGIPAAWATLLLFHPTGDADDFYSVIEGNVTAWLAVHIGMGIFVPMFAAGVFLLLRGVEGRAATISRVGLAFFAVFYAAWELLLGGGTGILSDRVDALPAAEHQVGRELVESYADSSVLSTLSVIGSLGLAAAMIGAVVALRGAYRLGWAAIVLMLVALPLIAIHEPPFGPIGLALFIAAVLLFAREQSPARAAGRTPLGQPVPAPPV